jgi:hypothetical protein
MRLKTIAISLAALAAMSAPLVVSAKDTSQPQAISPADAALADRAVSRGWLMYAYDQAAWHGTDDMVAKIPDFASKAEGWVVDGPANAAHLVFYSKDKDNPKAVYVADFRDLKLVSSRVIEPSDDATLTPAQLGLIEARRRAKAAMFNAKVGFCAKTAPNSIVLPPERPGGPYLVYFMTPQTSNATVPIGGHFLIEVAVDGIVGNPHPFSKSCLELPVRSAATTDARMAFVTSLLDPVPTEIHVFTMISMHLPLVVATTQNRLLWSLDIDNGRPRIQSMGTAPNK